MGRWTLVHSAPTRQEAELVKGLLEAHDIVAVVMDQGASPSPTVGSAEGNVAAEDVVRALYLVRKHHGT